MSHEVQKPHVTHILRSVSRSKVSPITGEVIERNIFLVKHPSHSQFLQNLDNRLSSLSPEKERKLNDRLIVHYLEFPPQYNPSIILKLRFQLRSEKFLINTSSRCKTWSMKMRFLARWFLHYINEVTASAKGANANHSESR